MPHVEALAQANKAEVILLRVAVNPAYEFAFANPATAGQIVAELEAESQSYMQNIEARLKAKGLNVSAKIIEGPVAASILALADDLRVDLIAMSTHGRSGIARWLIGSVADKIIHGAQVPVLLIRPAPR